MADDDLHSFQRYEGEWKPLDWDDFLNTASDVLEVYKTFATNFVWTNHDDWIPAAQRPPRAHRDNSFKLQGLQGMNLATIPRKVIDAIDFQFISRWEDYHVSIELLKHGQSSHFLHQYRYFTQLSNPGGLEELRKRGTYGFKDEYAKFHDGLIERDPKGNFHYHWRRIFNYYNRTKVDKGKR